MTRPFDPLGRKQRAQILRKYAETTPNGTPIKCHPTKEASTADSRQPKIIFKTEERAVSCAQALYDNVYESTRLYPYPCDRTPDCCHWHLTSRYKSNSDRKKMRAAFDRRRAAKTNKQQKEN